MKFYHYFTTLFVAAITATHCEGEAKSEPDCQFDWDCWLSVAVPYLSCIDTPCLLWLINYCFLQLNFTEIITNNHYTIAKVEYLKVTSHVPSVECVGQLASVQKVKEPTCWQPTSDWWSFLCFGSQLSRWSDLKYVLTPTSPRAINTNYTQQRFLTCTKWSPSLSLCDFVRKFQILRTILFKF